jgi:VWFA-related protein
LLEDGKPQKVSFVSFFDGNGAPSTPPPKLPPYVTTNRPEYQAREGPAVILVLDALNTPAENQVYVRQQMLRYLAERFDPSMRMAVLVLGSKLQVVQDFTQDPHILEVALQGYQARASAAGRQSIDVAIDSPIAVVSGVLAEFYKERVSETLDMRITATLNGLSAIAHSVAGMPGRKTVIWFSTSFPLNLALVDREDIEFYHSYVDQVREVANLMSDAHVALYAIDAHGLTGPTVADANQGEGRDLYVDTQQTAAAKETFDRWSNQASMAKAATETGGRIFVNTNDLSGAIAKAVEDSRTYYLLGFYPSQKRWDGKFHVLKVLVNRPGVKATHRRGYYATDPENWRKSSAEELKSALEKGTVASTGILFYARAMPPPPSSGGEVKVEFLVDAHTITFQSVPENAHYCNLEFDVEAFTPEGKPVKAEQLQADAPLRQQTFERIERDGLPMPVPIKLTPGKYKLRLGVRDNRTGMFGTAELSLTVSARE